MLSKEIKGKLTAQAASAGFGMLAYATNMLLQHRVTTGVEKITENWPTEVVGLTALAVMFLCSVKGLRYEYDTLKKSHYSASSTTTFLYNIFGFPILAIAGSFIIGNLSNVVALQHAYLSIQQENVTPFCNAIIAGYLTGLGLTLTNNSIIRKLPRDKIVKKVSKLFHRQN